MHPIQGLVGGELVRALLIQVTHLTLVQSTVYGLGTEIISSLQVQKLKLDIEE